MLSLKSQLEKASFAAGTISVIIAVVTAISAFYTGKDLAKLPGARERELQAQVDSIRTELKDLRSRAHLNAPTVAASIPVGESTLPREYQRLSGAVSDLSARLQKIEQTILTSPGRALEVPLLQRDLESLRQAQNAQAAAQKDAIDRVYDQNKWLLGGVSVSILALGLSSFLRAKASKEPAESDA